MKTSYAKLKKGSYKITVQCPCGGPSMSVPIEMADPDYVAAIEHENSIFKEALSRIERECVRDNSSAFIIAHDALENS